MSSQVSRLAGAGAARVNDIHSQLNETDVADVIPVDSLEAIRQAVARSRAESLPIAASGGRHAMRGQQFCSGGLLLDTRPLGCVLSFDSERGTESSTAIGGHGEKKQRVLDKLGEFFERFFGLSPGGQ